MNIIIDIIIRLIIGLINCHVNRHNVLTMCVTVNEGVTQLMICIVTFNQVQCLWLSLKIL